MVDCYICVTVIVSLSFEMLEDKHCLGVGGFDKAIIECLFVGIWS